MIPRELLATAQIPSMHRDDDTLRLFRRGGDFMIMLGGNELMNSRVSGSEEALADLTCEHICNHTAPHILIGGYGMGYTLRSALAALGEDAKVTVAELIPDIIDWARGSMADLTNGCLNDKRVNLKIADVADLIGQAHAEYDAILLDVDNGPDGLTKNDNDRLYSETGLIAARRALKNGGILAIWSAHPDPKFTQRMIKNGFQTHEKIVRARSNDKGARHNIWFGQK